MYGKEIRIHLHSSIFIDIYNFLFLINNQTFNINYFTNQNLKT